ELVNRTVRRLFEQRILPPRFSAISGFKQKGISWERFQLDTGNPPMLEIEKLNLFERRGRDALCFGPGFASIFALEQQTEHRGICGVEITAEKERGAVRLHRRKFKENWAGLVFGARQSKGVGFLRRADLLKLQWGLSLKKEREQKGQQQPHAF